MKMMSDKNKHIVVTAVMSFIVGLLCAVALRLQGVGGDEAFFGVALAGFCGGLAAGVGKEYGDECAEGNEWSWDDVAADIVGAIIGASLICFTIKLILVC